MNKLCPSFLLRIMWLILFFSMEIGASPGQNYQPVRSDRVVFFADPYKELMAIRIDSAKFGKDSTLYPSRMFYPSAEECFKGPEFSWIGPHVNFDPISGLTLFFNMDGDSIIIQTAASLGQKWTAFKIKDSISVEARITDWDTVRFLGTLDSVKTIAFQAFDRNMKPLNMAINNKVLRISKDHGMISTPNLFLFPDLDLIGGGYYIQQYHLAGISNPDLGVKNLSWMEVWDFQAGDELHTYEYIRYVDPGFTDYESVQKGVLEFLNRNDFQDSIQYQFIVKDNYRVTHNKKTTTELTIDTLSGTVIRDPFFAALPREAVIRQNMMYEYSMTHEVPLSKTYRGEIEWFDRQNDTCWNMNHLDGCARANKYIKGLGGPYYYCTQSFGFGHEERKYVYYKKGNETWGTPWEPWEFTSAPALESSEGWRISPNPAHDHINIIHEREWNFRESNAQVEILDNQGRSIIQKVLAKNEIRINVAHLPRGIYTISLRSKDLQPVVQKVIVH